MRTISITCPPSHRIDSWRTSHPLNRPSRNHSFQRRARPTSHRNDHAVPQPHISTHRPRANPPDHPMSRKCTKVSSLPRPFAHPTRALRHRTTQSRFDLPTIVLPSLSKRHTSRWRGLPFTSVAISLFGVHELHFSISRGCGCLSHLRQSNAARSRSDANVQYVDGCCSLSLHSPLVRSSLDYLNPLSFLPQPIVDAKQQQQANVYSHHQMLMSSKNGSIMNGYPIQPQQ